MTRRGVAAAATVLLLAGCGGGEGTAGPSPRPCAALPSADPAATLPPGFPAVPGQVLYEPVTQGATRVVHARVASSSFVQVRDQIVEELRAAGYTIVGTDQESVEAEAEFGGPREGTIKVEPLCEGHVVIRYKFVD